MFENQTNKGWMPEDSSYNHLPEYKVMRHLAKHLNNPVIEIKRVDNKYGPDLEASRVNTDTLIKTHLCFIETEQKRCNFNRFPSPPLFWSHWSFLARKIDSIEFADNDVYVLAETSNCEHIFWATFGDIRKFANEFWRVPNNPKEKYYRTAIMDGWWVYAGYARLAKHLESMVEMAKQR